MPVIPDRLVTCPEAPVAPTAEGTMASEDAIFKTRLAEAYIVCRERNATIADILTEYRDVFADDLQ